MVKDILEICVSQILITAVNSRVKMEDPVFPVSVDSVASVQKVSNKVFSNDVLIARLVHYIRGSAHLLNRAI